LTGNGAHQSHARTKYAGAPVIHVVAGAVIDAAGRVLIAQRPEGKHLAGGWEFPGGKLEPGEARATALGRELREELGIAIRNPRPLIRVRHTYPQGEVLIDMWVVKSYSGSPRGLDGQALKWLSQEELEEAELLPADGPIVRALRLPERLTEAVSDFYEVKDALPVCRSSGAPLQGLFCSTIEEGHAAAGLADFVVMRCELPDRHVALLCQALTIPVFVPTKTPETSFLLGASGLNDIKA
jgi:mutator protein MutT